MKNRTYSVFSYADAYFWKKYPSLKHQIGDAIGEQYVNTDTQIGNILSRLEDLGYGKSLAKQLRGKIQ